MNFVIYFFIINKTLIYIIEMRKPAYSASFLVSIMV